MYEYADKIEEILKRPKEVVEKFWKDKNINSQAKLDEKCEQLRECLKVFKDAEEKLTELKPNVFDRPKHDILLISFKGKVEVLKQLVDLIDIDSKLLGSKEFNMLLDQI